MTKTIFNIIQSNTTGGGMESIFLDYSQILKDEKFNVICLVSKNFCHLNKLKNLGIKTQILNIRGHFDPIAAVKLYFLSKKHSPELLIAHNGRSFACINLCQIIFKIGTIALWKNQRFKV